MGNISAEVLFFFMGLTLGIMLGVGLAMLIAWA